VNDNTGESGSTCEFVDSFCVLNDASTEAVTICDCHHLSDFSVLFDSGDDDWTTIRIVSLALLLTTWLFLAVFSALVCFCKPFRIIFNMETSKEKDSRILGHERRATDA